MSIEYMSIDYSIIVPAYNEEAMLEQTLQLLKDAMTTIELEGEIIVTDNNSMNVELLVQATGIT